MKLSICIPTAGTCKSAFAHSLAKLMEFVTLQNQTFEQVDLHWSKATCRPSNRERLVHRVLDQGVSTHLLFLDDDMRFDPWVVLRLVSANLPVIGVNYRMKVPEKKFVAMGLDGQRVPVDESRTGLQEVAFTGFGVSLFDVNVFRATDPPWFQPIYLPEERLYNTDDVTCFAKLRLAGFPCYIDHDASRRVSHIGDYDYSWE